MKKIILSFIIVFVLLSCTTNNNSNTQNESYEDIQAITIGAIDTEGKFILSDDVNDQIVGYSEYIIDSSNTDYQHLRLLGFIPDMRVYYSNDTKSADTTIIYENGKIIFYSRSAYYFFDHENQQSLDFK